MSFTLCPFLSAERGKEKEPCLPTLLRLEGHASSHCDFCHYPWPEIGKVKLNGPETCVSRDQMFFCTCLMDVVKSVVTRFDVWSEQGW